MSIPLGVSYLLSVRQSLLDLLHLLDLLDLFGLSHLLYLSRTLSPYNEHRLAPIEGLGDAVLSFRTAVLLLLWNEVPASGEGVRIVLLDEDVALWV